MKKRKKDDMFGFVMENATISAGTVAAGGLIGKIGTQLPSSTGDKVMEGMGTMSIIPTMHATGGIFKQLKKMKKLK